MQYKNLIENLKYIGENHGLVSTCLEGDNIYEVSHTDIAYPLVFITPQPHILDNPISTYNFVIYFIDRLSDGKTNRLDIHSAALKALNDIMLSVDLLDSTESKRPFTNTTLFTEKFADECAGGWIEVSIDTFNDNTDCNTLSDINIHPYSYSVN